MTHQCSSAKSYENHPVCLHGARQCGVAHCVVFGGGTLYVSLASHKTMIPLILAATTTGLIGILIYLLIFLVVCYLVFMIVRLIPIGEPWKQIITIIVCLILLLILIQQLGFL